MSTTTARPPLATPAAGTKNDPPPPRPILDDDTAVQEVCARRRERTGRKCRRKQVQPTGVDWRHAIDASPPARCTAQARGRQPTPAPGTRTGRRVGGQQVGPRQGHEQAGPQGLVVVVYIQQRGVRDCRQCSMTGTAQPVPTTDRAQGSCTQRRSRRAPGAQGWVFVCACAQKGGASETVVHKSNLQQLVCCGQHKSLLQQPIPAPTFRRHGRHAPSTPPLGARLQGSAAQVRKSVPVGQQPPGLTAVQGGEGAGAWVPGAKNM